MSTLTQAQMSVMKSDILSDPAMSEQPTTMDGAISISLDYNAIAVPDFWVWRSVIDEAEITEGVSGDSTSWSWPAFIARSALEQTGWTRLFGGSYSCKPSLAAVRQGFADIFSGGTAPAASQRAHLMSICRRKATRIEKLFAVLSSAPPAPSGNLGSTTSVATMGFEGPVDPNDVYNARLLP